MISYNSSINYVCNIYLLLVMKMTEQILGPGSPTDQLIRKLEKQNKELKICKTCKYYKPSEYDEKEGYCSSFNIYDSTKYNLTCSKWSKKND